MGKSDSHFNFAVGDKSVSPNKANAVYYIIESAKSNTKPLCKSSLQRIKYLYLKIQDFPEMKTPWLILFKIEFVFIFPYHVRTFIWP